MLETPFSHKTIKNTILTFGAMFSNIKIQRHKTDGTLGQTIVLPITYARKEKVFVRMRQDPNLDGQVLLTLPRFAFEITHIGPDRSRAANKNNKIICHKDDGSVKAVFTPVPWNIDISLMLLTKGTEDALDVMEQILPNFAPEYTATIKTIPDMNVTQDIPFTLNGVDQDDNYEGDFAERRLVITTFDFTAKINLYGQSGSASVITRTDTSVLSSLDNLLAVHTSTGNPITGEITSDFWTE
jgi:hypothetical protein